MSMIALAQRLRPGPRGLGHSLLLLIAVTTAIIVGLLAMHSLNSHAETSTPASSAIHEHGTAGAAVAVADHGTPQPSTDGECADCGGDASMLAMTCVLAVLFVALLLFLPRVDHTWGAALRAGPTLIAPSTALPRPPSLLVLCISRT
jgi:hypothetical protein